MPGDNFQSLEELQEKRLEDLKKKLLTKQSLEKGTDNSSDPLEKGTAEASQSNQSSKPLQKGTPASTPKHSLQPLKKGKPILCKKVGIDWGILADDLSGAIEKLLAAGVEVYILTQGSKATRQEVKQQAMALPIWDRMAGCLFTSEMVGPQGKATLCKKVGIEALFDDNDQIMQECWKESVWPFPIKTFHSHSPLEKGSLFFVQPKETLEEAIDLFLSPDCRFHDWLDL